MKNQKEKIPSKMRIEKTFKVINFLREQAMENDDNNLMKMVKDVEEEIFLNGKDFSELILQANLLMTMRKIEFFQKIEHTAKTNLFKVIVARFYAWVNGE